MYILIIECTDINTESTLDARDFLREEPWNGNKQSTSGEKRDNRERKREKTFGYPRQLIDLTVPKDLN